MSIAAPLSLYTLTAVPAQGEAWPVAVVTDRGIFIAAIVTSFINAITLIPILAETHHLTTGSTCELGRVSTVVAL